MCGGFNLRAWLCITAVGSSYIATYRPLWLNSVRASPPNVFRSCSTHTVRPPPPSRSPRCWGKGFAGQLGRGEYYCRGKYVGEMGAGLAAVDLGTNATASFLAAGADFTCAGLDDGSVKVCIVPVRTCRFSIVVSINERRRGRGGGYSCRFMP